MIFLNAQRVWRPTIRDRHGRRDSARQVKRHHRGHCDRFLAVLFALTISGLLISLGVIAFLVGLVFTLTVIGAVVGIPLMVVGVHGVIGGIVGSSGGVVFALLLRRWRWMGVLSLSVESADAATQRASSVNAQTLR